MPRARVCLTVCLCPWCFPGRPSVYLSVWRDGNAGNAQLDAVAGVLHHLSVGVGESFDKLQRIDAKMDMSHRQLSEQMNALRASGEQSCSFVRAVLVSLRVCVSLCVFVLFCAVLWLCSCVCALCCLCVCVCRKKFGGQALGVSAKKGAAQVSLEEHPCALLPSYVRFSF